MTALLEHAWVPWVGGALSIIALCYVWLRAAQRAYDRAEAGVTYSWRDKLRRFISQLDLGPLRASAIGCAAGALLCALVAWALGHPFGSPDCQVRLSFDCFVANALWTLLIIGCFLGAIGAVILSLLRIQYGDD